jgi:hypothetical protein
VTKKVEVECAAKLRQQIRDIIVRARESTIMDPEYDARIIEGLFECGPIKVGLPANEWAEHPRCDHNGVIEDRRFVVRLYIASAKAYLERQGLVVTDGAAGGIPGTGRPGG